MKETFVKTARIRFRQGDPAGIMFFADSYKIAHDAYEDFISFLGIDWKDWFNNPDWAVPIRHSSCEHLRPMLPSQTYEVRVAVDRVGKSSFTLKYFFELDEHIYAEVSLVHTFINKKSRSKTSIPSDIRDRLESYRSQSSDS
jgi:acyl-CoA thioesterase FadM